MFNSNQSNLFDCVMKPESTVSSQNSDEDIETSIMIKRDRRRELHTQAEQRRRDAIKNGYETLLPLIQTDSGDSSSNHNNNTSANNTANSMSKLSKATILQRTVTHIRNLTEQTVQKEKELENLKNELFALRIMNSNYEEMAKGSNKKTSCSSIGQSNCVNNNLQNNNQSEEDDDEQVPERVKFDIFTQFLLALFQSFDTHTKFDNFTTASTSIIHWMEEYCKPQNLNQITESILTEVLSDCYCSGNITDFSSISSQMKHQAHSSVDNSNIATLLSKNNFHRNQTNNTSVQHQVVMPTNVTHDQELHGNKLSFSSRGYQTSLQEQQNQRHSIFSQLSLPPDLEQHQADNSKNRCYETSGYLSNHFQNNHNYPDTSIDTKIENTRKSFGDDIKDSSSHGNVDEMMTSMSPNIDLAFLDNIDHDTLMADMLF